MFDSPLSFTLATIVPICLLGIVAVLIPRALFARMPRTLTAVGLNMLISSVALIVVGAFLFSILYALQGQGIAMAIAAQPMAFLIEFLTLGLSAAIIWGPILLIDVFGLAQKTEVSNQKTD